MIVSAALLGILFLLGKNTPPPAGTNPLASALSAAEEKSFDFGTISMAKGPVSHAFKLANASGAPVGVKTITTSCMCTTAYLTTSAGRKGPFGMPGHGGPAGRLNATMAPNETWDLEVVFDPAAHGPAGVGPVTRSVFVDDDTGGTLEFTIKALVTP